MLGDAHFTKGPFSQLVSNSIEFVSSRNWLAHLLKVRDYHCDQVLLILQERVKYFSYLDLWRILLFALLASHAFLRVIINFQLITVLIISQSLFLLLKQLSCKLLLESIRFVVYLSLIRQLSVILLLNFKIVVSGESMLGMEIDHGPRHHRILFKFSDARGCARVDLFRLFWEVSHQLMLMLTLSRHLLYILVKGLEDWSVLRARSLIDLKWAIEYRDLLL